MSGPIKHNTTGLWVEKKIQLRGQRRKRTYHAYSCRRKVQWLLSLRIVSSGKKGLSVKRQLKKSKLLTLSTPSTTMSKCQCQRATMAKALCAPMSDFQNPNSIFFFVPFLLVSKFGQKSFLCEVVLSRMANKQSHLSTGQGPLQHFRHLFQFTACLNQQDGSSWHNSMSAALE